MADIITADTKRFAELCQIAYKDPNSRPRTFSMKGREHQYNKENSTGLWCWYEDPEVILLGIHGANDFKLNQTAISQFLDPDKVETEIAKFCELHNKLLENDKPIFVSAHSLGCWTIASCEIGSINERIRGILFAPYVPNKKHPKTKFMSGESRFKKVFYDNDFFATNLLKTDNLTNAIVLTPRTIPFTFLNGHSISNFSDNQLTLLNTDIKKFYKAGKLNEIDSNKPQGTTINLMSYNVKMLSPLVFDLVSNKRAVWIPNRINDYYPDVEVVIINELFDDGAENIFDKSMRKNGFKYKSKKVSNNPLLHGKLEDGGVKVYSKYEIIEESQTTYKNSSKEDKMAGKGAVRITVMKDDIPIHIIGTHLQSGREPKMKRQKIKQFGQLSNKLVKNDSITIIGGDMNIDRFTQRGLLDQMIEENGLEEFQYIGDATTKTDFTDDKPKLKWLDYFFNVPNDVYDVSGMIEVFPFKKEGGFNKPNEERTNFLNKTGDIGEDIWDKSSGVFKKKKQRKRRRRRRRRQRNRIVYDLSDHSPIKLKLTITRK